MLTAKILLLLTLAAYATCAGDDGNKKKEKYGSLRNLGKKMACCEITEEDVCLCSIGIGSRPVTPRGSKSPNKTDRKKIITPTGSSSKSSSESKESESKELGEISQDSEELGKYLTATSSGRGFGSSSRISVEYELHDITEESEDFSESEYYTMIPNKEKQHYIKQTEGPHHVDDSTERGNLDISRINIGNENSGTKNDANVSFDKKKEKVNSNNSSSSSKSTTRDKHFKKLLPEYFDISSRIK